MKRKTGTYVSSEKKKLVTMQELVRGSGKWKTHKEVNGSLRDLDELNELGISCRCYF